MPDLGPSDESEEQVDDNIGSQSEAHDDNEEDEDANSDDEFSIQIKKLNKKRKKEREKKKVRPFSTNDDINLTIKTSIRTS